MADHEFSETESAQPSPPRMSGLMLYWLTVATFGIYLPFWAYRYARGCAGPDRRRSQDVAWALGVLIPPACWALLREFQGHAVGKGRPRTWWVGFPAALYLVLLVGGGFSPLRHFILTHLFLLPIPFVIVQCTWNRASEAGAPGRARTWQWVVAPLGTLALVAVIWLEGPGFVQFLRPFQSAGATVSAASEAFNLTIPATGWQKFASGTIGDAGSDLELSGPGSETWLIAYTVPRSGIDLHTAVTDRRSIIFSEGQTKLYEERRFFLAGSDHVPVSIARYRVDYGLGTVGAFYILTAETDDHVHELVSYTAEPLAHAATVQELVDSFAISVPAEEDGEEDAP